MRDSTPVHTSPVTLVVGRVLLATLVLYREAQRPAQSGLVEAAVMFAALALLLGVRTRLAHLFLLARHLVDLATPAPLTAVLAWTALAPLGGWAAFDALRAKLQHSRLVLDARGLASLAEDPAHPEPFAPPASGGGWVTLAMLQQLALWRLGNGSRLELLALALVAWPLGQAWVRPVGLAAALFLGAGRPLEDWLLLSFWLPPGALTSLLRAARRRRPGAVLYFDSDCGVCGLFARALLCIQRTSTAPAGFALRSNEVAPAEVRGVTAAQVDAAVLWVDDSGARVWGAAAFAEVARTFPLSWPLACVFRTRLASLAYDAFAKRRHRVSAFLGLGACGLAQAPAPFEPEPRPSAVQLAAAWAGRALLVAAALGWLGWQLRHFVLSVGA